MNKYCFMCGSTNIEVESNGVNGSDFITCGDCGRQYNVFMTDETLARDEFDNLLNDDKDFEEQWGDKNKERQEANFQEWFEEHYNND